MARLSIGAQQMKTILLILLVIVAGGCKSVSNSEQAKVRWREANELLKQQSDVAGQWGAQYGKAFNPESRSKFPSNRALLRTQADELIKLLDESSRLGKAAAEKLEQASGLTDNENDRKLMTLVATGLRKDLEVDDLLRSQIRLVHDEEIRDEKTFNARFMELMEVIQQREKESDERLQEWKRLLGATPTP
jgi:uncharacterized protein YceK